MHGEKEEKETKVSPRIVVTKADEECQMEPGDVVLDVESKDLVEEKEKKKTRSMSNFIKKLNVPRSFLKSFKTLPINLIADANDFKDPPKKFSKLDVRSRRNFPITFVISLVVYLLAFTYYLTDDNPETDSELIVENN